VRTREAWERPRSPAHCSTILPRITCRRAFDTETPKGTLKRFHREVSDIVDATAVADQMRIIDTLSTTEATVTSMCARD